MEGGMKERGRERGRVNEMNVERKWGKQYGGRRRERKWKKGGREKGEKGEGKKGEECGRGRSERKGREKGRRE